MIVPLTPYLPVNVGLRSESVLNDARAYHVTWYDSAGKIEHQIACDVPRPPVTKREIDGVTEPLMRPGGGRGDPVGHIHKSGPRTCGNGLIRRWRSVVAPGVVGARAGGGSPPDLRLGRGRVRRCVRVWSITDHCVRNAMLRIVPWPVGQRSGSTSMSSQRSDQALCPFDPRSEATIKNDVSTAEARLSIRMATDIIRIHT